MTQPRPLATTNRMRAVRVAGYDFITTETAVEGLPSMRVVLCESITDALSVARRGREASPLTVDTTVYMAEVHSKPAAVVSVYGLLLILGELAKRRPTLRPGQTWAADFAEAVLADLEVRQAIKRSPELAPDAGPLDFDMEKVASGPALDMLADAESARVILDGTVVATMAMVTLDTVHASGLGDGLRRYSYKTARFASKALKARYTWRGQVHVTDIGKDFGECFAAHNREWRAAQSATRH